MMATQTSMGPPGDAWEMVTKKSCAVMTREKKILVKGHPYYSTLKLQDPCKYGSGISYLGKGSRADTIYESTKPNSTKAEGCWEKHFGIQISGGGWGGLRMVVGECDHVLY